MPWPRHTATLTLGLAAASAARVRFTAATALVTERDFVPVSKTGAELLFHTFSQRHECASTLVTSNLPFEAWAEFARSI